MKKSKSYLSISLACSLLISFMANSYANDGDRITLLEKEVHELKLRLTSLESSSATPMPRQKPAASIEGWKALANWRSLKMGMSLDEVRVILGEPSRITGGNFTSWIYPNRGGVTFYEDKLYLWQEPR